MVKNGTKIREPDRKGSTTLDLEMNNTIPLTMSEPIKKKFINVSDYLHFKEDRLDICGATGIPVACLARKCIAHKFYQAHIYHSGNHLCKVKNISHPK